MVDGGPLLTNSVLQQRRLRHSNATYSNFLLMREATPWLIKPAE